MIKRTLKADLLSAINKYPVVCLLGSRQVGKTTLAKQIKNKDSVYLDLELTSDLLKLENAEWYLQKHQDKLVIIDEIQRKPEIFPLLRALIDQKRTNGRFLILGSASKILLKQSSESLAGRVCYYEMTPLNMKEIETDEIEKLWLRGGYPDSFLSSTIADSFEWRLNMITTYLERDIPQLNIKVSSSKIKRLLQMIAHNHAQLWNTSMIANSLDISTTAVNNYLDILEETFFIRRLPPYFYNLKKRLIKSPKIYIRDTGVLHSLLHLNSQNSLFNSQYLGNSWEGFVIEEILKILPRHYEASFFRTNNGAEIDLLLSKAGKANIAIEIKNSLSPKPSKGLYNSMKDLSIEKAFIFYPGNEDYQIKENIWAISIKNLISFIDKI